MRQCYTTNWEYDAQTIDRVSKVYDSGIEIFNSKTDNISSVCFDQTGNDFVVVSLKENGIWELPIKKSLICWNRGDKGFKVFDAELQSWKECLHWYDIIPDIEVSHHPAINGAISKLYRSQSINF